MPTRLVIFDLDGTLIDSKQDLVQAVNATREEMGMTPLAAEVIASYVGDGAPMLIRRSLGPDTPEAELERALDFFIQYYRDHKLDHTTLYPGVKETLDALASRQIAAALLTNKPVKITHAIMDGLGLASYFACMYGGNSFATKKPHPEGALRVMEEMQVSPNETVMVGDSGVDIQTARNAGIRAVGVLYGFQPHTLDTYPPDVRIDRLEQLLEHL